MWQGLLGRFRCREWSATPVRAHVEDEGRLILPDVPPLLGLGIDDPVRMPLDGLEGQNFRPCDGRVAHASDHVLQAAVDEETLGDELAAVSLLVALECLLQDREANLVRGVPCGAREEVGNLLHILRDLVRNYPLLDCKRDQLFDGKFSIFADISAVVAQHPCQEMGSPIMDVLIKVFRSWCLGDAKPHTLDPNGRLVLVLASPLAFW